MVRLADVIRALESPEGFICFYDRDNDAIRCVNPSDDGPEACDIRASIGGRGTVSSSSGKSPSSKWPVCHPSHHPYAIRIFVGNWILHCLDVGLPVHSAYSSSGHPSKDLGGSSATVVSRRRPVTGVVSIWSA